MTEPAIDVIPESAIQKTGKPFFLPRLLRVIQMQGSRRHSHLPPWQKHRGKICIPILRRSRHLPHNRSIRLIGKIKSRSRAVGACHSIRRSCHRRLFLQGKQRPFGKRTAGDILNKRNKNRTSFIAENPRFRHDDRLRQSIFHTENGRLLAHRTRRLPQIVARRPYCSQIGKLRIIKYQNQIKLLIAR